MYISLIVCLIKSL